MFILHILREMEYSTNNIMRDEVKDTKGFDLMCRAIISEMKNMERIIHRLDPS